MNLEAVAQLCQRFENLDIVFVESGGERGDPDGSSVGSEASDISAHGRRLERAGSRSYGRKAGKLEIVVASDGSKATDLPVGGFITTSSV